MNVVFVDDAESRIRHLKRVLDKREFSYVRILDFPFPVDGTTYQAWIQRCQEYSGPLAIILDLDLAWSADFDDVVARGWLTPMHEGEVEFWKGSGLGTYWQGLLLAREALLNPQARPLAIIFASNAALHLTRLAEQLRAKLAGRIASNAGFEVLAYPVESEGTAEDALKKAKKLLSEYPGGLDASIAAFTAGVWRKLRTSSLELCQAKQRSYGFGHPFWAHHTPHGAEMDLGGDPYRAALFEVRDELAADNRALQMLPLCAWSESVAWQNPPIRALAQFDGRARDLSTALHLISEDANRRELVSVYLMLTSDLVPADERYHGKLKHDYLWFNICALGKGLLELVDCFQGVVRDEMQKDERLKKGLVTWVVAERESGVQIEVKQRLRRWYGDDESAEERSTVHWQFGDRLCFCEEPVTPPEQPQPGHSRLGEAYGSLTSVGGRTVVSEAGFQINITSQCFQIGGQDIWLVAEGGTG